MSAQRSQIAPPEDTANQSQTSSPDAQGKHKKFFGMIKKKLENSDTKQSKPAASSTESRTSRPTESKGRHSLSPPMTPVSNPIDGGRSPRSPLSASTSPSRLPLRLASPRLLSPASSLIFERNVQESGLPDEMSSSVPSHIQTEDHIPAVLEASSIAITNDHLDPADVEILTHAVHQPATATVAAGTHSEALSPLSPTLSVLGHHAESDAFSNVIDDAMTTSSYASIDNHDLRRLSFISFADVVQGEHAEQTSSSLLPISASSPIRKRSPSPVGSPGSSSSMQPFGSAGSSVKGIPISRSPPLPLSPDAFSMSMSASPGAGDVVSEKMSAAMKAVGTAELHDGAGR